MRKLLIALSAVVCGLTLRAASGSSEDSAVTIKIGDQKAVQLVESTDLWSEGGVYYLKMTLRKNHAYTVWFEGDDADRIGLEGLEVYAYENWDWDDDDWGDDDWGSGDDWGGDWGGGGSANEAPWASFDMAEVQYGNYVTWMQEEAWDPSDPSSWTYYICLSGDVGLRTTVHVVEGIQVFLPDGLEANPRKITFRPEEQTFAGATTEESSYYFISSLEKDHKYVVRTTGGTAGNPLKLNVLASVAFDRETLESGPYDQAFAVFPKESGSFRFAALANATNAPFGFAWQDELGTLVVELRGAPGATWTLDKDKTPHANGEAIPTSGEHTIAFSKAKGFSQPAPQTVTVRPGKGETTVVVGTYNDTYDPKDDAAKGATKLKVSSKESGADRTLWGAGADGKVADPADWFSFSAKEGVYYNFRLDNRVGDAVITVLDSDLSPVSAAATGVASVGRLAFASGGYYVRVDHGTPAAADSSYTLVSSSANVGSIKFGKTAVKATDSTGKVELKVKRTAKEGKVRVRYATVSGTAVAGRDFIAQSGELVWENGDKKDRTITIRLIPELIPVDKGTSKAFSVVLSAVEEQELADDEYPAQVIGGPAEITISGTAKPGVDPYAVKKATGKEAFESWTGTFSGVLESSAEGTDRIASVTLTAKANGGLSAKVTVGGATQSLSGSWTSATETSQIAVLESKTGSATFVLHADGRAELAFEGDDAAYSGVLARNNSKVQAYLDRIVDYVGSYTVSLVPGKGADVPAGFGYLTLALDNKGTVKFSGLLADGTKVSGSSVAALRDDGSLLVPVYAAKGAYCFGGTLEVGLAARACDGRKVPCVDSSCRLVWNEEGVGGWEAEVKPVGGYYDTVINLQAYYNGLELSMDGIPVEVDSNVLSIAKGASGQTVGDVTFSFDRKTGLIKGKLTYGGHRNLAYNGVLLITTDEEDSATVGRMFFVDGSGESVPLSIVALPQ